jgi:hypothetical protein
VLAVIGTAGFFFSVTASAKRKKLPRVRLRTVTTPVRSLKVSSKYFVSVASNFQKGAKLLKTAPLVNKSARHAVQVSKIRSYRHYPNDPGVIFRATVQTPGGEPVAGVFKPFQKRYQDGFKELAACRIAAHLSIRQPPCTQRFFKRNELKRALRKVPRKYRRLLIWQKDRLYGFFRLWAPRYKTRVGRLAPSRDNLLGLAKQIRPRGNCANHRICRDMSDLLVFDFLISNNDRQYNVGTIRPGPKKILLFPIDWGDGFTGNAKSMKRKIWYRKAFYSLVRFRRSLIAAIQSLSRQKLVTLTTGDRGRSLISKFQRDRLMAARKAILKRVKKLQARYGAKIFFSSAY